ERPPQRADLGGALREALFHFGQLVVTGGEHPPQRADLADALREALLHFGQLVVTGGEHPPQRADLADALREALLHFGQLVVTGGERLAQRIDLPRALRERLMKRRELNLKLAEGPCVCKNRLRLVYRLLQEAATEYRQCGVGGQTNPIYRIGHF